MPPSGGIFQKKLFLVLAFALLIGDAAAGLASGLAGSLAFAATAVLGACTEIFGLDGLDTLHVDASITLNLIHYITLRG
jgi:hypothetical protein